MASMEDDNDSWLRRIIDDFTNRGVAPVIRDGAELAAGSVSDFIGEGVERLALPIDRPMVVMTGRPLVFSGNRDRVNAEFDGAIDELYPKRVPPPPPPPDIKKVKAAEKDANTRYVEGMLKQLKTVSKAAPSDQFAARGDVVESNGPRQPGMGQFSRATVTGGNSKATNEGYIDESVFTSLGFPAPTARALAQQMNSSRASSGKMPIAESIKALSQSPQADPSRARSPLQASLMGAADNLTGQGSIHGLKLIELIASAFRPGVSPEESDAILAEGLSKILNPEKK